MVPTVSLIFNICQTVAISPCSIVLYVHTFTHSTFVYFVSPPSWSEPGINFWNFKISFANLSSCILFCVLWQKYLNQFYSMVLCTFSIRSVSFMMPFCIQSFLVSHVLLEEFITSFCIPPSFVCHPLLRSVQEYSII